MPTSYTSILKLALPATGELSGTWGDVVNNNITSMVEQAIAGLATIDTWIANSHTLTTANGTTSESRCAILQLDDDGVGNPTAAATVVCPAVTKIYIVKNACGQTATIKTPSGTGVAIPNGATGVVFCDGTNVVEGSTFSGNVDINGGTIDGTTIGGTTPAAGSFTNLAYTGTLTGGTGVINIGSGQVYKDASGNVGIGTSSPRTAANYTSLGLNGTTGAFVDIFSNTTRVATFIASDTVTSLNSVTSIPLTFGTANTERMRITSAGLVGIGTSSPTTPLDVLGSPGSIFKFRDGTVSVVGFTNVSDAFFGTDSNHSFNLLTNGTARVTINTSGSVGIGGPTYNYAKLAVYNGLRLDGAIGTTASAVATFDYQAPDTRFYIGDGTGYSFRFSKRVSSTTTDLVTITDAGNVGIGTASPVYKFNVVNSTATSTTVGANILGRFQSNGNGADANIQFSDGVANAANIGMVSSNIYFAPGGTERMRLDTSGNLGLGVTPSAWGTNYKAIESTGNSAFALASANVNPVKLVGNAYATNTDFIYKTTGAAAAYECGNVGTHRWFTAPSGTAGNVITFTNAMTLTAAGGLAVGTTTDPGAGNIGLAAGKALQYSASAYITPEDNVSGARIVTPGVIGFYAGGSQKARITTAGALLIGSLQDDNARITVSGAAGLVGTGISLFETSTGSNKRFRIYQNATEVIYDATAGTGSNAHVWGVTGSEVARITGGGIFLLGTSNESYSGITARQTIRFAGAGNQYGLAFRPDADNTTAVYFSNASQTLVGTINLTTTATAYNTSSDYRLKENVRPLTGALDRVMQLEPSEWDWKSDGSQGVGFIAHKVQAIRPQAVTGTKDAVNADGKPIYQGMDASFLIADLTAALQELKTEFDAYKAAHP